MPTSIQQTDIIIFGVVLLGLFLAVIAIFFISAWVRRKSVAMSPYSGLPLRRGRELPYDSAKKILQFLYEQHQYDNKMFDLHRAAICRETGRIFPYGVSRLDTIHVDWTFLKKRYPGNYVSWGSLTDVQQQVIRSAHDSLEGFQTDKSSSHPAPSAVEPEFAFSKPGPLYVDINTKVLLGWQCVPGTNFEVLIVQKPQQTTYLGKG